MNKRIRVLKFGRISWTEGSAVMRMSDEHLVDSVSPVRIGSPIEKLPQMRRRNVDGSLDGFFQQTVQGEDPVRLYAVL